MQAPSETSSKGMRWAGYALSGLAALFLLLDGGIKVLQLGPALEATTQLGFAQDAVLWLGVLQLACLILYLLPPTAILGAVLLTGYLGGAIAIQVRAAAPVFSLIFPVIIGALLWGGLFLRDAQLRALFPLRRR